MTDEILKQDLDVEQKSSGSTFSLRLLFEKNCELPDQSFIEKIFSQKLGTIENFKDSENKVMCFSLGDYSIEQPDSTEIIHPLISIFPCQKILDKEKPLLDNLALSQCRQCPEAAEILGSCEYEIFATDLLTDVLNIRDKVSLKVNFLEALMQVFPSCKGVHIMPADKILSRDYILNTEGTDLERFMDLVLNIRFFRIAEADSMMVDSLGMITLSMPDVQYHFHSMDPNDVVVHAYTILEMMIECEKPFADGDSCDSIHDGEFDQNIQWFVQYEDSLIQPSRPVIDVNTGEFAAGDR